MNLQLAHEWLRELEREIDQAVSERKQTAPLSSDVEAEILSGMERRMADPKS